MGLLSKALKKAGKAAKGIGKFAAYAEAMSHVPEKAITAFDTGAMGRTAVKAAKLSKLGVPRAAPGLGTAIAAYNVAEAGRQGVESYGAVKHSRRHMEAAKKRGVDVRGPKGAYEIGKGLLTGEYKTTLPEERKPKLKHKKARPIVTPDSWKAVKK